MKHSLFRHPSLEEEGKMRFIKISQAKHKKESISILLISTSIGTCKKFKDLFVKHMLLDLFPLREFPTKFSSTISAKGGVCVKLGVNSPC